MVEMGQLKPVWDDVYKTLEYTKQPLMDTEVKEFHAMGYHGVSLTGSMYSSKNPMPVWVGKVAWQLKLRDYGSTFYRMDQLDIMPPHVDHFDTYMRVFNKKRTEVKRAVVFLEDWKPGHYFEINKVPVTGWLEGQYVMWTADVEHSAANIGIEPRYTLQITGV